MQKTRRNGTGLIKAMSLLASPCFMTPALGDVYKCVDETANVVYQSQPCNDGSQQSITPIKNPPPSSPEAGQRPYVNPAPDGLYQNARRHNVTTGPLEAWDRFSKAWNRGDREGVMKELTPSMQERFGPVYDRLQNKNKR